MSSREWLNRHGLKAKKLGFYDVLANVAFKHRDGVVDLNQCPGDDIYQTDAVGVSVYISSAKFPHNCIKLENCTCYILYFAQQNKKMI